MDERACRLVKVKGIQLDDCGAAITFDEGNPAHLDKSVGDYDILLAIANESEMSRRTIGISLEGARILDMGSVDTDTPDEVVKDNSQLIAFSFCGQAGIYALPRNHWDFPRLEAVLRDALRARVQIQYVANRHLNILDAKLTAIAGPPPASNWVTKVVAQNQVHDAASWDLVEKLITSMDGIERSDVVLHGGKDQHFMRVSGGKDGQFRVFIQEGPQTHLLLSDRRKGNAGIVLRVAGADENVPAELVHGIETVMIAANTYTHLGGGDPRYNWKQVARSKLSNAGRVGDAR